jgi:hypothetical protein
MPSGKKVQITQELRDSISKLDLNLCSAKKINRDHHPSLSVRFWKKVKRSGDNECWIWTSTRMKRAGKRYRNGTGVFHDYGIITQKGKRLLAHRVSFFLHHGRWPSTGMVVMHTCDNPPCVNPAHLVEGTQEDNSQDANRKGRLLWGDKDPVRRSKMIAMRQGDRNPAAKLSNSEVDRMFKLRKEGFTQDALAKIFGVSQSLISMILSGRVRPRTSD